MKKRLLPFAALFLFPTGPFAITADDGRNASQ